MTKKQVRTIIILRKIDGGLGRSMLVPCSAAELTVDELKWMGDEVIEAHGSHIATHN